MQENWQSALKKSVTTPSELLNILALEHAGLLDAANRSAKLFPLRVPLGFVARMQKGDPNDPLLRQVLPLMEEETITPGFSFDPLGEKAANPLPGLLHKYNGRVLLILAAACAINCRYCFRRHFPYSKNTSAGKMQGPILDYIANDQSIYEVILSGGDPLLAEDDYLEKYIQHLAAIPHLQTLRIHSRLPIVLPERITPKLVHLLTSTRLQTVMVVHCNHPNELDHSVGVAIERLRQKMSVLNQAVLLRGVNDSSETLIRLSKRLFECGILPYYLHLLDRTQNTAHFERSENEAKGFIEQMRNTLSGYLVPRLVKEESGANAKSPLFN